MPMGVFIQVEIVDTGLPEALGQRIASVCPVDIFAMRDGRLAIQAEEEDECTLCGLCLKAAPAGAIRIHKRYSGEVLTSTGSSDA
jgi:NAD-dependent dihydropyrimidine dehydrogenase PreA subunit